MKITSTILALLTLGICAFGSDNNGMFNLAVLPDGHGGSHFLYYQAYGQPGTTSVALYTASGGIVGPFIQDRPLSSNGDVKFVVGTDQHGRANTAYIPTDSHFAQAGQ